MKQINSIESKQTYYTVPQLAIITSESVAVWRKRILFRNICYTKCGKNVRVSPAALEQWLALRSVAAIGVKGGRSSH